MNVTAIVVAIVWCVAMAALGGVLAGKGGVAWFRSLKRPRMQMSLWTFFVVTAIVYVMYGVVIYRLIALDIPRDGRIVCLTGIGVTMLYGEVWNYIFFGLRSPLAGFAALTACLPLLIVIETALFLFEPVSAWVLLPYGLYFVLYNIPWSLRLWKLNPSGM